MEASSCDLEELALELKGHFSEAAKCPHANFVLQKFVGRRTPKASRIVALELLGEGKEVVVQTSKHRYGCRILQRLVEFCDKVEADQLCDLVLSDARDLCTHPYGNYTLQHILQHGAESHCRKLVALLSEEAAAMAMNFHASAVVGEALRRAPESEAFELARALVQEPGLMSQMSRTKHGHAAAQLAIKTVTKDEIVEPSR
jgi:pumilio RNA-binding family